jgi:hypothetical protein
MQEMSLIVSPLDDGLPIRRLALEAAAHVLRTI